MCMQFVDNFGLTATNFGWLVFDFVDECARKLVHYFSTVSKLYKPDYKYYKYSNSI